MFSDLRKLLLPLIAPVVLLTGCESDHATVPGPHGITTTETLAPSVEVADTSGTDQQTYDPCDDPDVDWDPEIECETYPEAGG